MVVTVNIDEQRMREIQVQLGNVQNKAPIAISRAMNRSVTAMETSISKGIRGKYHIKTGDVKGAMRSRKASPNALSAGVDVTGGVIGLDKFKVSPKTVNPKRKSQLKISVRKDSAAGGAAGAFNANINGLKVMKRTSEKRLPIERLYGPSVPQMAKNDEVSAGARRRGAEVFEDRLKREIRRLIERSG